MAKQTAQLKSHNQHIHWACASITDRNRSLNWTQHDWMTFVSLLIRINYFINESSSVVMVKKSLSSSSKHNQHCLSCHCPWKLHSQTKVFPQRNVCNMKHRLVMLINNNNYKLWHAMKKKNNEQRSIASSFQAKSWAGKVTK